MNKSYSLDEKLEYLFETYRNHILRLYNPEKFELDPKITNFPSENVKCDIQYIIYSKDFVLMSLLKYPNNIKENICLDLEKYLFERY